MSSINSQRQFYNTRWQQFRFANRLKLARCNAILQGIAATKLIEPKILDLGCGEGWMSAVVGVFGPTVGVELSNEAVKAASAKYPHVKFIQADVFNWDYPKEHFDIVISQEVIEHVENQMSYIRVIYELLRKDGYLILTTPNARTFNAMPKHQREAWSNQPIENLVYKKHLKSLLEERFAVSHFTTIIPGYGLKGIYRFVNSIRLRSIFARIGLETTFDSLRLKYGYGLHFYVLAKKK